VDGESYEVDLGETGSRKIFETGLDTRMTKQPVGQISAVFAHRG
jgi:hypothetical protein